MSRQQALQAEMGAWSAARVSRSMNEGFKKLLGISLAIVGRRRLAATIDVGPQHLNGVGAVHGGVLMSRGDSLGAAMNLGNGQPTATLESKTNFLRPASGAKLHAVCRAVHIGRKTSVWKTEIRDGKKELVAIVTQTQLHYLLETTKVAKTHDQATGKPRHSRRKRSS